MRAVRHFPCVYVLIAYASGILLSFVVPVDIKFLYGLSGLFGVLACLFQRRAARLSAVLIFIIFFLLGGLSARQQALQPTNHITHILRYYYHRPIRVRGIVASEVELKSHSTYAKQQFHLKLKAYQAPWGWREISGKVLVFLYQDKPLAYGQLVDLEGRLHQPFHSSRDGPFSYREYLRRRGITCLLSVRKDSPVVILEEEGHQFNLYHWILRLRRRLIQALPAYFNETEKGLIQAMFLGDRSQIPAHIKQLYVLTGAAHVLPTTSRKKCHHSP